MSSSYNKLALAAALGLLAALPLAEVSWAQDGIAIEDVSDIPVETLGVLPSGAGFATPTLYSGMNYDEVQSAMERLPARYANHSVEEAVRLLLLSPSEIPHGKRPAGTDLLAARLRALGNMGAWEDVKTLIAAVPPAKRTAEHEMLVAHYAWWHGDTAQACDATREAMTRHDPFPLREQMLLCQALEGEKETVELGLSLLEEEHQKLAPFFRAGLLKLTGASADAKLPKLSAPVRPVELALLLALGEKLPEGILTGASPNLLVFLANHPDAPAATRLAAAMQAVADGLLPAEALKAIYQSPDLSGGDDAYGHILSVTGAATPEAKAQAVKEALAFFGKTGKAELAYRLFKQDITGLLLQLPDDAVYLPVAKLALRAFVEQGELAGARSAARFIGTFGSKEEGKLLLDFLDFVGKDAPSKRELQELAQWEGGNAAPATKRLAARWFAILEAWGVKPSAETLRQFPREALAPETLATLQAAAAKGIGATVLAYAGIAANANLANMNDTLLLEIVKTLGDAGLKTQAKALAVEAFLKGLGTGD